LQDARQRIAEQSLEARGLVAVVNDEHCQPACPAIDIERQVRPRPASPRAAPWLDMTRPTLDEMLDILIEAVPGRASRRRARTKSSAKTRGARLGKQNEDVE